MEWSDKENRIGVIAIHKVVMEPNTIFKIPYTLFISEMLVYRAIDRYNETSFACGRKRSGYLRRIRMEKAIKTVMERIRRN